MPVEIMAMVFQSLLYQDVVSSSFVCQLWRWVSFDFLFASILVNIWHGPEAWKDFIAFVVKLRSVSSHTRVRRLTIAALDPTELLEYFYHAKGCMHDSPSSASCLESNHAVDVDLATLHGLSILLPNVHTMSFVGLHPYLDPRSDPILPPGSSWPSVTRLSVSCCQIQQHSLRFLFGLFPSTQFLDFAHNRWGRQTCSDFSRQSANPEFPANVLITMDNLRRLSVCRMNEDASMISLSSDHILKSPRSLPVAHMITAFHLRLSLDDHLGDYRDLVSTLRLLIVLEELNVVIDDGHDEDVFQGA